MIYNDGPEMDENLRITKCPRCGNTEFDDDAEYCQICGLPLYNYCLGEEIYSATGNYEGTGPRHKNLGNARFCKHCGARTEYLEQSILKHYEEARKDLLALEINDIPL